MARCGGCSTTWTGLSIAHCAAARRRTRWLRVELRYLVTQASYWARPYDMKYDDRRWRWQTRGCNRDQPLPAELIRALIRLREDGGR